MGDPDGRLPDVELLRIISNLPSDVYDDAVRQLQAIGAFTTRRVAYGWDSPSEFVIAAQSKPWAAQLWSECTSMVHNSAQVARGGMQSFSLCDNGRKGLQPYVSGCFLFFIYVLSHLQPRRIYLGPLHASSVISYTDAAWEYTYSRSQAIASMGSLVVPGTSSALIGRNAYIPSAWLSTLVPRENQILLCELLAVLCVIYTDREVFRNSAAIFFVDSLAGACSAVRGVSHEPDVQWLVTAIHAMLFKLNCKWWIEWLPSESNPSDALSRFEQQDFVDSVRDLEIPEVAYPSADLRCLFGYLDSCI